MAISTPWAPDSHYTNPLIGTLADLMQRNSAARAEGIRRGGEISGQAWSNAGNQIAGSLGALAKYQMEAPQRAQEAQARDLELQVKRGELTQQQDAASDRSAMDTALANAGDDEASFKAALDTLPPNKAHLKPGLTEAWNKSQAAKLQVTKLRGEVDASVNDWVAADAYGLAHVGHDKNPDAVLSLLTDAKGRGMRDADPMIAELQQNPAAAPAIVARLVDRSKTQRELSGQEADRALRQTTETRAAAAAQAAAANIAADNKRADETLALARQREAREAAAAAAARTDTTLITPAGLDVAALNYKKTGVMPALGMGDKTTRTRIINRAAELTPADETRITAGGTNIAANKADFKASADSLTALTKQRNAIAAFENTAGKNIDLFLAQAGKVVDTGSPLANTAVRFATGKLLGSPDQAAYDAARQVAVNEIAKITSNPNLSGTLSDSARKEVEAFNPSNATLKQSVAVMRLLRQDMGNRATSLDDQIAQVNDTLHGKTAAPPPATAAAVPANVAAALKGLGPGKHTLSDHSVWLIDASGAVTKAGP